MKHSTSLFGQVLTLISRREFAHLTRKWRSNRHSKGFTSWNQFVAMLFCQLAQVKTFVGTSANALRIQISAALIAMLLIKYLQFKSRMGWSLSNLVALLRRNLFTYRDLWEWVDDPFHTPPEAGRFRQKPLPFLDSTQR